MIRSESGKSRWGGACPSRIIFTHVYDDIISVENLLAAWQEFVCGKRGKKDVQEFQYHLMDNILALHRDLKNKTYRHGEYQAFKINDPKPRDIHKATVRDRLVHHAIYRQLYSFFDRTFIGDSYSCRKGKGTHRAMNRFRLFSRKASKNNTRTLWVLKCDVRKFFASVDHDILLGIVGKYISDADTKALIAEVVGSFHSTKIGKGLPLGNLTSQLLVNIYMNEFDQFVKHSHKAKYYVRYADDFVIMHHDKRVLESLLVCVETFLSDGLSLALHPNKVSITTLASGIDFLGWVHFPNHRVLRTTTKFRMLKRLCGLDKKDATAQSYLGMLRYGNAHMLAQLIDRR